MLQPGWVGRRVSVRRVIERAPDGRLLFGDVVGELLALDEDTAMIDTRNGPVEVPVALIALARDAPPSTAQQLELAAVIARGLHPEHTAELGGWTLRANGGFTKRANSVLPLHQPGMPLPQAIEQASAWYAGHRLPLIVKVPTHARRLLDGALGALGWDFGPDVHVLAARLDLVSAMPAPDVELTAVPDPAWLARYRDGAALGDPVARALLARHDRVCFATLRVPDGTALAVGRGTVDDGWLGVSAVDVAPRARRRGYGTQIMRSLWAWGRAAGATRTHLEVASDNAAALALYRGLGYHPHHDYRYRFAPE